MVWQGQQDRQNRRLLGPKPKSSSSPSPNSPTIPCTKHNKQTGGVSGDGGVDDDRQLQEALRLSQLEQQQQQQQEQQQQQQRRQQQAAMGASGGAGAGAGAVGGLEDPELAAAIALSLSSTASASSSSAGAAGAGGDDGAFVLQQAASLEAARLRQEEEDLKKALQASLSGDN
jgi:hypothetical protein